MIYSTFYGRIVLYMNFKFPFEPFDTMKFRVKCLILGNLGVSLSILFYPFGKKVL